MFEDDRSEHTDVKYTSPRSCNNDLKFELVDYINHNINKNSNKMANITASALTSAMLSMNISETADQASATNNMSTMLDANTDSVTDETKHFKLNLFRSVMRFHLSSDVKNSVIYGPNTRRKRNKPIVVLPTSLIHSINEKQKILTDKVKRLQKIIRELTVVQVMPKSQWTQTEESSLKFMIDANGDTVMIREFPVKQPVVVKVNDLMYSSSNFSGPEHQELNRRIESVYESIKELESSMSSLRCLRASKYAFKYTRDQLRKFTLKAHKYVLSTGQSNYQRNISYISSWAFGVGQLSNSIHYRMAQSARNNIIPNDPKNKYHRVRTRLYHGDITTRSTSSVGGAGGSTENCDSLGCEQPQADDRNSSRPGYMQISSSSQHTWTV